MKALFLKRFAAVMAIGVCHLLMASAARAETPIQEPGDYAAFERPEQIQWIPNARVMWFVLGTLQSKQDVDVVAFDYNAGERFFAQMFIAENNDLRHFSPHIALIGQGLPAPTEPLPFALPQGMGAIVARSDSQRTYYDIFTQMSYYPRAKVEMDLPQSGRYYVAVFGQPVGSARYALDIGVTEDWSLSVVARYPINWYEVRTFFGWSLWPALSLPLALAGLGLWLPRRRNARLRTAGRANEQQVAHQWIDSTPIAVGLGGASMLSLWMIGLAQTTSTNVFFVLLIGVTAMLTLLCGSYLITPLRERVSLQTYARNYAKRYGHGNKFARVKGFSIHYSDDGPKQAQAVLLIHGFAASMFSWRLQRQQLIAAGYRVIAIDLLGCGGSSRLAEAVYTTQDQAEIVLGLMNELGIQAVILIGHSFGARVAMQTALLAPARVQRLIAVCAEALAIERPAIAKLLSVPVLGYAVAFYSTSPFLVRTGLKIMSASDGWIDKTAVQGYQAPLHVTGTALAQEWQARSIKDGRLPVPQHLADIQQPVLLIWGAKDSVFPLSEGHFLQSSLPHAQLHVVPNAGHLAHEEAPQNVDAAMLAWLAAPVQPWR